MQHAIFQVKWHFECVVVFQGFKAPLGCATETIHDKCQGGSGSLKYEVP
jgi:hypothetical protein